MAAFFFGEIPKQRDRITGSRGNTITVITNGFGYYTFTTVLSGDAYIRKGGDYRFVQRETLTSTNTITRRSLGLRTDLTFGLADGLVGRVLLILKTRSLR